MTLDPPILSRFIRINPTNWTGAIALRMEFTGCTQAEQFHCKFNINILAFTKKCHFKMIELAGINGIAFK